MSINSYHCFFVGFLMLPHRGAGAVAAAFLVAGGLAPDEAVQQAQPVAAGWKYGGYDG